MKRVASIAVLLGSATLLGCASAPRGPLDETGAVRDPWNEPGQTESQTSIRLVPESLDGGGTDRRWLRLSPAPPSDGRPAGRGRSRA